MHGAICKRPQFLAKKCKKLYELKLGKKISWLALHIGKKISWLVFVSTTCPLSLVQDPMGNISCTERVYDLFTYNSSHSNKTMSDI